MSQIEEHVQLAQQAVHHPVADTHFRQKPRVRKAMDDHSEAARMASVKLSDFIR